MAWTYTRKYKGALIMLQRYNNFAKQKNVLQHITAIREQTSPLILSSIFTGRKRWEGRDSCHLYGNIQLKHWIEMLVVEKFLGTGFRFPIVSVARSSKQPSCPAQTKKSFIINPNYSYPVFLGIKQLIKINDVVSLHLNLYKQQQTNGHGYFPNIF